MLNVSEASDAVGQFRSEDVLVVQSLVLVLRDISYAHLVKKRLHGDLMKLESQIPRVISEDKSGDLFICEYRYAVTVLSICLSFHLGYHLLPPVKEVRAAGTVRNDHIRPVRLHGLEFLMSVG